MGVYDVPAVIDYILTTTGQPDLFYVGHSMGTTMFFVILLMKFIRGDNDYWLHLIIFELF